MFLREPSHILLLLLVLVLLFGAKRLPDSARSIGRSLRIFKSEMKELNPEEKKATPELYINGVLGPLNLQIKVSLLVGVIISAPFWIYQLWAFIAPGLHKKEKRRSILFIIVATPFFALGATLGYVILPVAVRVLLGFTPNSLANLVKFDDYLDFVLRVILLFGGAFELPVFLVALNLAGVVSGKGILKPWRFAIFGIALFTAAFTPTGDPVTMSLLALPLIAFYFAAGGIALLVDRRRGKSKVKIDDSESSVVEDATPIDDDQD